jgi:excinuclease UvrABC helicase subunit UvrB
MACNALFANTLLRVFATNLLAQNDDTACFATVPEVYPASQARTYATVGVRLERKAPMTHFYLAGHKPLISLHFSSN